MHKTKFLQTINDQLLKWPIADISNPELIDIIKFKNGARRNMLFLK